MKDVERATRLVQRLGWVAARALVDRMLSESSMGTATHGHWVRTDRALRELATVGRRDSWGAAVLRAGAL